MTTHIDAPMTITNASALDATIAKVREAKKAAKKAKPTTTKETKPVTTNAASTKAAKKSAKKPTKKAKPKNWMESREHLMGETRIKGLRGEQVQVFGKTSKSRMVRIDAGYADYLTREAKRQGMTLVEFSRTLAPKK